MAVETKSGRKRWVVIAISAGAICCLSIAILSGILIWTQTPRQTKGPIPQPGLAITAENIAQVRELYCIPQPGYVYDVAWSPDGRVLAAAVVGAGGEPSSVQLWDAVSGSSLRTFEQVRALRIAFSADGKMLAAASDASLTVWSLAEGSELSAIPLTSLGGREIAFTPDSRALAFSSEDRVNLLEMPGGRELDPIQAPGAVWGFAFLPDGEALLTATLSEQEPADMENQSSFTVWDIENRQAVRTFTLPVGLSRLAVSPDGEAFATGQMDGTLKVWELASGIELQTFSGFRFGTPRFAFSPDGSVLAAGEGMGFEIASPSGLRLLDVTSGGEVPILAGHEGVITNTAFSPDGRLLATASEDKTVRIWGIPPEGK